MKTFLYFWVILLLATESQSQCVVANKEDYTINASFTPVNLLPQNACVSGPGSFTAEIAYNISIEGSNIPRQPVFFYQITLTCGNTLLNASGNLPITNSQISGTYVTAPNYFRDSDCATSTLESLNCYGEKNINFIGSGPNGLSFNINCNALEPSENAVIENLNGRFLNGAYRITWEESGKNDITYFVVERSKDQKSFDPISDKIVAKNEKTYEFFDSDNSIFESIYYYRILIMSKKGIISYSIPLTGGSF